MRSHPVAFLLADLGITKTHSRPYTSTDNPYSEAHFKTLKYCPQFPKQFGSLLDARSFCQLFFNYYNNHHHHSGIALLTPQAVHDGLAQATLAQRQSILDAAFLAHPERFVKKAPLVQPLPDAVWINQPVSKPPAPDE
jgi:putative transposase